METINYLLNYMEDFEIEYLKEQYTEEVIKLLEIEKNSVVQKIENILKENKDADIYMLMSENIDEFI